MITTPSHVDCLSGPSPLPHAQHPQKTSCLCSRWLPYFKVLQSSSSPSSYGWTLQWTAQVFRLSRHLLTPRERRGKTSRSNSIQLASHHPQEPCLLQGGLVVFPEGLNWSEHVSYYSIQLGLEKAQQFLLWSRSSKVAHLPTAHPALVFWRAATALCGNGALKG